MNKVPTESDWGDYGSDRDASWAHKVFFGKTNEEMQLAFRENPLERASDIRYMPCAPFKYYIFGFRDFVLARNFDNWDDSSAASSFLNITLSKVKEQPNFILSIINELLPAIEFISKNQALYDADEDIFGDFENIYNEILNRVSSAT